MRYTKKAEKSSYVGIKMKKQTKTREQEKWEDKRDRKGRLRDFYVILAGDERFIRTIIYNLKPWKRDENNMAIIPYKRNVKVIKRLLKQNLNKQKIQGDEK